WAGDVRRLVMLQNKLQDALERVFQQQVSALGPKPTENDYGAYDRSVERLASQLKLDVTVKGRGDQWTNAGDLSTILEAVDLAEIEEISMRNSLMSTGDTGQVELRFRRSRYRPAVELGVSGPDKTWVKGLKHDLGDDLSRNKPRWAFLTWTWTPYLVSLAVFIAVVVSLQAIFPAGSLDTSRQVSVWLLVGLGYTALLFGLSWAMPKAIPSFEVLPVGEKSRGGRRLAAVVGLSAFMLANVIIPVVLTFILGD
ncbi:MAG: hypothetical protein WC642_02095, partial [Nocardioides sp.]